MHTFVVTTAATDLTLLTAAEMRVAAGVSDASEDANLAAIEARVSASIMAECNIAVGGSSPPTLRRETLTETYYGIRAAELILSRRHNVVITSVTVDGTALDETEYLADSESGLLYRLRNEDTVVLWCGRKIVVVYEAGFSVVPGDLKQAAMDFFRVVYREAGRDPLIKSERENIPGVMEKEVAFWVGSIPGQSNEGAVPDVVAGQLKRFRNYTIG